MVSFGKNIIGRLWNKKKNTKKRKKVQLNDDQEVEDSSEILYRQCTKKKK